MRMHIRALALSALVLLVAGSSVSLTPVAAQDSAALPIFLALPDVYPDVDGRVMLLREPGREIVVLSSTASAEDLGVGLDMLSRFRRDREPPPAGRGHMIPIVGYAPTPLLTPEWRDVLETALAELRERPVTNVGNLGPGRWMRFVER